MNVAVYVATSNAGKLRDFALAAGELRLLPLPGLETIAAPAEDAETFEGNARAKATYYSLHAPGAVVVADDSGLEVEALGGAPGVYSARYAERGGALVGEVDAANNAYLLGGGAGAGGAVSLRAGGGAERGLPGYRRGPGRGFDPVGAAWRGWFRL